MVVTGGYVADRVHGFQALFERFCANDGIPYYGMIYYGGIAQASYGSSLIFLAVIAVVIGYPSLRMLAKAATRWMEMENSRGRGGRHSLCQTGKELRNECGKEGRVVRRDSIDAREDIAQCIQYQNDH